MESVSQAQTAFADELFLFSTSLYAVDDFTSEFCPYFTEMQHQLSYS